MDNIESVEYVAKRLKEIVDKEYLADSDNDNLPEQLPGDLKEALDIIVHICSNPEWCRKYERDNFMYSRGDGVLFAEYIRGRLWSILKRYRWNTYQCSARAYIAAEVIALYRFFNCYSNGDVDDVNLFDYMERFEWESISGNNINVAPSYLNALNEKDNKFLQGVLHEKEVYQYIGKSNVGFDRVQFRCVAREVDEAKLYRFMTVHSIPNLIKDNYIVHTTTVNENPDEDKIQGCVCIPTIDGEPKPLWPYKYVKIEMSPYSILKIGANHFDNENKDMLLEIRVEPKEGFEQLGNIENYSYTEIIDKIQKIILDLKKHTGITLEIDSFELQDVEINLTFQMPCTFNQLMDTLVFIRHYAAKPYQRRDYSDLNYYNDDRAMMASTGISLVSTSKCKTMKIYDKWEEIKKDNRKRKVELVTDERYNYYTLVRIEYSMVTNSILSNEFDSCKLKDLSQKKLEDVFVKLSSDFIENAYERYRTQSTRILRDIFRNLKTDRKSKWRETLLKRLKDERIYYRGSYSLVEPEDVLNTFRENPLFDKHPQRYFEVLVELLEKDGAFIRSTLDAHDIINRFILISSYLFSERDDYNIIYLIE